MLELDDQGRAEGACHCGAIRFQVRLTDGLESARRCNCSLCRMRGAVAVSAQVGDLEIVQGADVIREYRFNTGTARHYFCPTCGIYTHHRRRSNPDQYGVNLACLKGASPFDLAAVPVLDGAHHPRDGGGGVAGVLRFEPGPRA